MHKTDESIRVDESKVSFRFLQLEVHSFEGFLEIFPCDYDCVFSLILETVDDCEAATVILINNLRKKQNHKKKNTVLGKNIIRKSFGICNSALRRASMAFRDKSEISYIFIGIINIFWIP